jgi:hypothetical protein
MRNERDGHIAGRVRSEIAFQVVDSGLVNRLAQRIRFSTAKHAIVSDTVELAMEDQYLDDTAHVLFAFNP